MHITPKIENLRGRDIIINPQNYISASNLSFPQIAKLCDVGDRTTRNWKQNNRADAEAIQPLIDYVSNLDFIDLSTITNHQLRQECQKRGWNKIIDLKN
jgi:hypothetical protein